MNSRRVLLLTIAGMLLVGVWVGSARAGIISGSAGSTTTGGVAFVLVNPPAASAPNNDNSSASPNTVVLSKNLIAVPLGAVVDIVFNVLPSAGVTEYRFSETVTNNTIPWSSYRIELGYGTRGSFVPSSLGDGLDFDFPNQDPTPTSTAFTTFNHQSETLDFTGGTVSFGGTVGFSFSIDMPDLPGGQFTLRQIPNFTPQQIVPAPSTLTLVGMGTVGVVLACRRKRK